MATLMCVCVVQEAAAAASVQHKSSKALMEEWVAGLAIRYPGLGFRDAVDARQVCVRVCM